VGTKTQGHKAKEKKTDLLECDTGAGREELVKKDLTKNKIEWCGRKT